MIKKTGIGKRAAAGILAAVCVSAAALGGCGTGDYQAVDLSGISADSTRQADGAQQTGDVRDSGEAGAEAGNAAAGSQNDALADGNQPGISPMGAELAQAPAPNFTDVSDTVYIKGNQVRLRTSPSTSGTGNISAVLDNGTPLKRTGDSDDWCRVSYNGATLYVSKLYVTTQQGTAAANAGTSAASGKDVNAGSGTTGKTGTENAASTGTGAASAGSQLSDGSAIGLDAGWKYAEFSAIKTGTATFYRSSAANRKGITVCVNAGHGTNGGGNYKTLCHPDGTPKVTGGSTSAGAVKATAVSSGMTFKDGTPERDVTLALALALKPKLLAAGYDVVMIRESNDVQLDNIARTVIANNTSDCHIALHWDSSESNKGAFYMSVPNVASYRAMEPVASNWQKHNQLGESLISGLRGAGVKIFSGGSMEMDLTQTSYSTIPSVDIELGDKVSDHSAGTMDVLANGLLAGINAFFGQ